MEVDSWVSVQARRERFEQLYEDSPLTSPQSTPLHPAPRPRTLSTPNKNLLNCDEARESWRKTAQISNHERDHKISKFASNSEASLGSQVSTSGKFLKNNTEAKRQVDLSSKRDEKPSESNVTPMSSAPKRIPVFKAATASSATDRKFVGEEGAEVPINDSQGKRGRFFSHMRSRSHGNFVMKRDSSAEKNTTVSQQNGVVSHKENKCHKDWLTPKCKQRSIDNLLSNEDSKSNSSFEGKQKLVSNVMKNMKNKETPTVLRKFSFSSKNEKDIKNMKEKSVTPNIKHKQSDTSPSESDKSPRPTKFSNKHKSNSRDSGINMDHKLITEENTTKNNASDIAIVPVLIAKAVAEVASKRCSAQTRGKNSSPSSLTSEDRLSDPPARPPRRRAAGPGPAPRRKGKAPSPPSQSSTTVVEQNQGIHNDSLFKISSDESPDFTACRLGNSFEDFKSCESISSCHSAERSFENLDEIVHKTSTPVSKIFRSVHSKPLCKSQNEQRNWDDGEKEIFKTEIQSINFKNTKTSTKAEGHHDKDKTLKENKITEVEGLPPGPPPKKPPRTFAYDIYRNISLPTLEVEGDDNTKAEKAEGKNSQPIYAVPVKKKNNKMIPKPPVRSKSDLSKEVIKPSVAPKPPHVLAKAKRASLVDPLSSPEKDEEAAITSEFQRQAHVRYSLRKPSKQPPTPSCRATEKNTRDNSELDSTNDSLEIQHDPNYSTINFDSDNDNLTSNYSTTRQKRNISSITNSPPESSEMKSLPRKPCSLSQNNSLSEYEDIMPIPSSTSPTENEQPLSLTNCFASTPAPDVTYLHTKRSMSDETLYKGSRQEEPVYATPTFKTNNHHTDQICQKELHYMCSVLFTDDEEADGGRDRAQCRTRRNSIQGREKLSGTEAEDGSKGRSSLISAWKREFRQSCRQVQSKIKKTVIR